MFDDMITMSQPPRPLFPYGPFTPVGRFPRPFAASTPGSSSSLSSSSASSASSASGTRADLSSSYGSESDGSLFASPRLCKREPETAKEPQPPSRTSQYKKIMKPLLERKRRARINKCLDELKDLMTTALQEQGENVSKLEKADILELTVRHLHKMKQAKCLLPGNPAEELRRFQTGYSSCAHEAATFLLKTPGVDLTVGQGLLNYLSTQVNHPVAVAASQARITATPEGPFDNVSQPGSLMKTDLTTQASVSSPFNSQILCNPGLPSIPPPSLNFPQLKYSKSMSNINSVRGTAGLLPMSSLTPPPLFGPLKPNELPPRPSSTPETSDQLKVSVITLNSTISRNCDLVNSIPELISANSTFTSPTTSAKPISVLRPEPVKLCLTDPVWRPF